MSEMKGSEFSLYTHLHWKVVLQNCRISFRNVNGSTPAPLRSLSPRHIGGESWGKDWREHYKECVERLSVVTDYDIALVAAGGYGMLIADYIYMEQKKSVMYVGGALQIFFGVIGKRWFDNKEILEMMNDSWVRPDKKDKPVNFGAVEKGVTGSTINNVNIMCITHTNHVFLGEDRCAFGSQKEYREGYQKGLSDGLRQGHRQGHRQGLEEGFYGGVYDGVMTTVGIAFMGALLGAAVIFMNKNI